MLQLVKKFEYPKLTRTDSPTGRRYITPNGEALPSVTTILGATKDNTHLIAWRKRIGDKKADETVKDAATLGRILHENLENYILGNEVVKKSNLVYTLAQKMSDNIIENGLKKLSHAYGMEAALYCEGLYAGTADLIAEYEGEMVIVDYKNSIKIKKEEWLEDYYCQLCAYAIAHNEMFGTKIKKAIIMMSARPISNSTTVEYKNFVLEGEKFEKYSNIWLSKVESYLSKN
jgi:genome maintenance exonuclease 1